MDELTDPMTLALELLPSGVVVADGSGGVLAANNAARVLLGLDDVQAATVCCEGQRMPLADLLRDHAEGMVLRRKVTLEHPEFGWLQGTLTRGELSDGAVRVHLLVERGPAPDWRLAGRSDPLSVFAHELRNALTSLREGLSLVAEGAAGQLTPMQQRLLDGVREDANRMARLSDDMVAANRLSAGRVRVTARDIRPAELIGAAVQAFASAAAAQGVDLAAGEADPGLCCHADRDLLIQALDNLVGNAVKYTPAGGRVRVGARAALGEDGEPLVELWVRDTGPGLPPEAAARITRRGGGGGTHSRGGSGLGIGLSIVREIAEQHGGSLAVDSEAGRGSCFRLRVPEDYRRSQRWLLGQVADSLKLARAVGAPLSLAEVRLAREDGGPWEWTTSRGLVQLPLIEECVAESLRPSDAVVFNGGSATLVLHDVDGEGALRVAGRAVFEMARLLATLPEPCARCELSLGVASYPVDGETAEELLAAAGRNVTPLASDTEWGGSGEGACAARAVADVG